ncbi:MAG TPA: DMP19 family protein [Candidatus Bacteroides pullicola]|uniref:DMP19 family protein n=1 Tax=Candidatus Bacteroides pullicola TaxID=2838475 RepID=A0A9D1ZIN4_9BACE|nr:DMP19 family protein [Candidatus Bacteroides pullicola]
MEANQIKVTDEALRRAASEGMDAFLRVFTDAYYQAMGGTLTAEAMPLLNASQHTLLAYTILRDELMEGGFCQLIQNGWGPYIFHNPVARALRDWGLDELAKVLYAARKVYDAHREDLERERTDEEFMAMYEQYEAFDDLEDRFLENEEEWTAQVAQYVDGHLELFAGIGN